MKPETHTNSSSLREIQVTDQTESSALDRVYAYYLNKQNLPTLRSELLKQGLLLFIGISGATLYLLPAQQYSKDDPFWLQISTMVGTTFPALAVLYIATDTFLKIKGREKVPDKLKTILRGPSRQQAITENASIGLGSALSSLPLTGLVLKYHLPHATLGFLITQAIVIQIDNTVLHFLPIKLAFQNPLYRLPYFLTIEQLVKLIKTCCRTPEERQAFAIQLRKMMIHQQLKQLIINSLDRAAKQVILGDFSFVGRQLKYHADAKSHTIIAMTGADAKRQALTIYGSTYNDPEQPHSTAMACLSSVNSVLRKTAYLVGVGWFVSGLIGYLVNPVNQLEDYFGSETKALLASAPSLYFLTVLFSYFGGTFLTNTYDYLTSWGKNESKIPLEVKFYPKTFALLMLINVYLSCFAYGAACQLIEDNFAAKRWDFLRPILLLLAKTSLPFLSLLALIDFYRAMLGKFALHFGGNETKMVAETMACIEQLKNGVSLMDGDQLQEDLNQLEEPQLKDLLNLDKQAFNDLIIIPAPNQENNIQEQGLVSSHKNGLRFLFFKCCKGQEEKQPLLEKALKENKIP